MNTMTPAQFIQHLLSEGQALAQAHEEPRRAYFAHLLATDDDTCVRHRETLRAAAAILNGTTPWGKKHIAMVKAELAAKLLDAAAMLCNHCRVESDGRCRYCDKPGLEPC
jgi:hypothetical protein